MKTSTPIRLGISLAILFAAFLTLTGCDNNNVPSVPDYTSTPRSGDEGVAQGNATILLSPSSATLTSAGSVQFQASGGFKGYTWNASQPKLGSIDSASGLYTTAIPYTSGNNTITAKDSNGDIGTATVTQQ